MISLPIDPILHALAINAANSALLFVIVAPVVWVLRNRSPQLRHALWTIVLLRLALPPSLDLSLSAWSVFTRLESTTPVAVAVAITETTRASLAASVPATRLWLFALWVSGLTVVGATLLRSRRLLRRISREARAVDEPRALRAFERAKERLGIGRPVALVTGAADVGAFTIGTVRPLVFLPKEMLSLTEESLECVLAHELVHVKRLDDLDRQLQAVLQSVYFFNPVVWVTGAMRSVENELVCDGIAIARARLDPTIYGRSILDVLRLATGSVPHAPMFIGRRKTMARRIDSIFHTRLLHRAVTTAVIVLGLVLLPLSGDEPRRVEGDVVAPTVVSKVLPAYPAEARTAGVEGIVILLTTIDTNGDVTEAEALESTRDDFKSAATDAVRQWKFKPATLEGRPVAVKYTLTIRFRLDEKEK